MGRLASYNAKSGKELWSVDLKEKFGASYGRWAMAENVIVDRDHLFCLPGGDKGLMVALEKDSGRTVWKNTDLKDTASYCSPIIITHRGVRQLITISQKSVIGIDIRTGEMLWSHPFGTKNDQHVNMPIFSNGYVLVSSGHSTGTMMLKINPDSKGVKEVWSSEEFDNCHGGVILVDGYVYGSGCRMNKKRFFCADFMTGKITQVDRTMRKVSMTYADGMLYGLTDKGLMYLLALKPGGFSIVSEFNPIRDGKGLFLSHPVIFREKLYIRHGSTLYAYDVAGK